MSIYEILAKEHQEIEKLLNELHRLATQDLEYYNSKIRKLYEKVSFQLTSHAEKEEEEIFYFRLEKNKLLAPLILEAEEGHFSIKKHLKELSLQEPINKTWIRKFNKIYRIVLEHVQLEENKFLKRQKRFYLKKRRKNWKNSF
jgi:hemerythrin superfamily protein